MRSIYLLAIDQDLEAASEVEALLKARGWLVRMGDAKLHFPPAQRHEITLALWSSRTHISPQQLFFINRAIDAWSDGKLILGQLEHGLKPHGLRDIDSVDLTFAPARLVGVNKIIEIATALNAAPREEETPPPAPAMPPKSAPPSAAKPKKKSGGWFGGLFGRKSKPGDGNSVGASRSAPEATSDPTADAYGAGSNDIFISYAHANGAEVYPLVKSLEATGHSVWIDKKGLDAGVKWAAEIVRAIKASETFCLMCSADAFQSDNVRREIYIATKYKRYLVPVLLDQTEMPEDFEFFLVDRNWLDLSGVAESERPQRLIAALAK